LAEVVEIGPGFLRYRILEERVPEREVGVEVALYPALLKGDKMADLVRMATELGATRIQPLIALHSVAKEMGEAKLERLKRVAVEAAKQSGRLRVPEILPPIPLKALPQVEQGLLAHPGAGALVREVLDLGRPLALAVGPEGGFSEEEVELLVQKGFTPVSLGRRTLRSETAALALLALVTAGEGR
ncbi:MAG: 16S rRNA (uracil(1498)-N(3))-methyltransferase, partial [Thermus sp.]